jgi:nucleoside-diphosphate-sugar epimerase
MKVLMTGATGWVGRTLAPLLLKRGHTLRCLVRDVKKAKEICEFPAEWVEWQSIDDPLSNSAF